MNVEYTRDEKVAPYVVIVAKDGSKFFVVDQDCKVSYNDAIYDRIAESNVETAIAKVELRVEKPGTKESQGKLEALEQLSRKPSELEEGKSHARTI